LPKPYFHQLAPYRHPRLPAGFLTGKLKAYEQDEDLLKLAREIKKDKKMDNLIKHDEANT
jgi:hypothetical protein